jgi:RNA polymerase sigma-B factor
MTRTSPLAAKQGERLTPAFAPPVTDVGCSPSAALPVESNTDVPRPSGDRRRTGSSKHTLDLGTLHWLYAQSHDRELEAELMRRHESLALQLARRFARRGEPTDDLYQVALLGLLRALRRYDPERGVRFSTYAVPTILGELKRHFRDRTWLVRPTRRIQEAYLAVSTAIEVLGSELGRPPTCKEIADYATLPVDDVIESLEASAVRHAMPLEVPAQRGDDGTGESSVSDDGRHVTNAEDHLFVVELLRLLPKAERDVVVLSFFSGLTQGQIATRLGTSHTHVWRLRRRALNRLRVMQGDEVTAA